MLNAESMVGLTDTGQPLVLAGGGCEHWLPGNHRLLNSKICWYCRWADFRKTTFATISHSICRCPDNQIPVIQGSENETIVPPREEEQG